METCPEDPWPWRRSVGEALLLPGVCAPIDRLTDDFGFPSVTCSTHDMTLSCSLEIMIKTMYNFCITCITFLSFLVMCSLAFFKYYLIRQVSERYPVFSSHTERSSLPVISPTSRIYFPHIRFQLQ